MLPDALIDVLTGFWGLAVMTVLVLGDAFFVVVPGEIAVSTMGALSASAGTPPLWAVIGCAAAAAAAGDLLCYGIGRAVGTERWSWMRAHRIQRARQWAKTRLERGTAVVLFTARFVPFARLAINLVAGAMRLSLPRYAGLVALAATGWAAYQAAVGALVATIVPGGPLVAVMVSIAAALALGLIIDLVVRRLDRRRDPQDDASE